MLERIIMENAEKEMHVKYHEEKIARLTRKLEKWPAQSLKKSSETEEEDKASIKSESSNGEHHSKKGSKLKNGCCPSLMIVEQILDLIANAVKAQLGEGVCKIHLYAKPYTKRVDTLYMPHGYHNHKNSSNLMGRTTQNSMWHISSRRTTTLAWMST